MNLHLWLSAIEATKDRFQRLSTRPYLLTCRLFHVGGDQLLELPDEERLVNHAYETLSRKHPGIQATAEVTTIHYEDPACTRLFLFSGSRDGYLTLVNVAQNAGIALTRGPEELPDRLPLKIPPLSRDAVGKPRYAECHWLNFVFELAATDQLPSESGLWQLWQGRGPVSKHPWDAETLRKLAGCDQPDPYLERQLRKHYTVELTNPFIASVEAVNVLTLALEILDELADSMDDMEAKRRRMS